MRGLAELDELMHHASLRSLNNKLRKSSHAPYFEFLFASCFVFTLRRRQTQHLGDLGRRHRVLESVDQQHGNDGVPHPQY